MRRIGIIIVTAILMLALAGCGGKSPTSTTATFLDAIKTSDAETIKSIYAGGSYDMLGYYSKEEKEEFEDFLKDNVLAKMFDFEYELYNEKIEGNKATVDVKVKTYEFGAMVSELIGEMFTKVIGMAFTGASDKDVDKLIEKMIIEKVDGSVKIK